MNAYDEYLMLIAPHFLKPLIVSVRFVYVELSQLFTEPKIARH